MSSTDESYLNQFEYKDLVQHFLTTINTYESDVAVKTNEEGSNAIEDKSSSLLCTILNDACDQIILLGGFAKDGRDAISLKVKELQQIAHDFPTNPPVYDPVTSDLFRIAFNKEKMKKLIKDSLYVKYVFNCLITELKHDNTYSVLTFLLDELRERKDDEIHLDTEYNDNLNRMQEIKCGLINDEKENSTTLYGLCKDIAIMYDTLEDIYFENIMRVKYIGEWQEARAEQKKDLSINTEIVLNSTIDKYKKKIEKEIRVNAEIELFLNENEREVVQSSKYWRKRYDKDLESRELMIATLKEKREDQDNAYIQLKGMYELRNKEIDDYLNYKELKRIEEEKQVFLASMATKIQTWWRGLMVRCKLGRFNPKKIVRAVKGRKK